MGTLQLEALGLETNERPIATNLAWFRGSRLLQPIVRIMPPVFDRRLFCRDESWRESDCNRWSPGTAEYKDAPLRESAFRLMFRRERIEKLLAASERYPRTLSDLDPSIYQRNKNDVDHQIACGSFSSPSTGHLLARGLYHEMMVIAHTGYLPAATSEPQAVIDFNVAAIESEIQAGAERIRQLRETYEPTPALITAWQKPVYVSPYPAWQRPTQLTHGEEQGPHHCHQPTYDGFNSVGASAPSKLKGVAVRKPTKEELAKAKELTGMAGEIAGIKTHGKPRKVSGLKWDANFSDDECPPEPDVAHVIDESRKTHNPLDHTDLVALRRLNELKGGGFPIEIFTRNEPRDEVADRLGISGKTLQKQIERFKLEAQMLDKFPDAPRLTDEQLEDIMERGAAYLLVNLNEWAWYELDLETHGTVRAAIAAFRDAAELKAVDRKPIWRNPEASKFAHTETLKEVKRRYDEIFKRVYVLQKPGTQPWKGVLSTVSRGKSESF